MNAPYHDKARGGKSAMGKSGLAAIVGVVGAAAASILIPLVAGWEGKSNDPYVDLVGIKTVCFGETHVQMRRYTDAECEDMLARSLAAHAKPVMRCTPSLRDKPDALAAAVSLAYNIGTDAYCRSTVDRRFDAGDIRGACDAFLAWRFAGGREVRGLLNRRKAERQICLRSA